MSGVDNKRYAGAAENTRIEMLEYIDRAAAMFGVDKHESWAEFRLDIKSYNPKALQQLKSLKRRRDQASVPDHMRCIGVCSNGKRCSRQRQGESMVCGTHNNNAPRGTIDCTNRQTVKSLELVPVEIQGIGYYADDDCNIYSMRDVMQNKSNPRIIAKYECIDGVYTIKKE